MRKLHISLPKHSRVAHSQPVGEKMQWTVTQYASDAPKVINLDKYKSRLAWKRLHQKELGTLEWFNDWKKYIPKGCGCTKEADNFLEQLPPDFSSPEKWFKWTVDYHNLVNQKLEKKIVSLEEAYTIWRNQSNQPFIEGLIAVTSCSLIQHHLEVQERSFDSWKKLGLKIVSGNAKHEIPLLQEIYDIEFVEVTQTSSYGRPTAKIYDLLNIGKHTPILLINSDIEIQGDQSVLLNALANRENLIGSRYNWTGNKSNSVIEYWGLDAFMLYPEQIPTFPNLDFGIGQTMWDWWVPFHLDTIKAQVRWFGEPYFYHESHEINWKPDSLMIGRQFIKDHYNVESTQEFWEEWRRTKPYGQENCNVLETPKIKSERN